MTLTLGILVVAALVTPPDVITQVILFIVIYSLYEISIYLVARVERQREAKLRAEGVWFDDEDEITARKSHPENSNPEGRPEEADEARRS